MAEIPSWRPKIVRGLPSAAVVAASGLFVWSAELAAAPTPNPTAASAAELHAVEAAFMRGQELFDRADFTGAARAWADAEALMPRTAEHRENRRVLLAKIAVAYGGELLRAPTAELARGVLVMLDAHLERLQAIHPGEAAPAEVIAVQQAARATRDAIEQETAARRATMPLKPSPAPVREGHASQSPRSYRKSLTLALAGGTSLGAGTVMLGMFIAGVARARALQHRFDDPEYGCNIAMPEGVCAQIYRGGAIAERVAISGLVLAPALLGAGVAMLSVAARTKRSARRLEPMVGRHTVGFSIVQKF